MAESTPPVIPAKGTQPAVVTNPNDPIRYVNITARPVSINVTRPERVSCIIYPEGYKPMPADAVTEVFLTPKQARSFVAMKCLRPETAEATAQRKKTGQKIVSARPGSVGGGAAPMFPAGSIEEREFREAEAATNAERAARAANTVG